MDDGLRKTDQRRPTKSGGEAMRFVWIAGIVLGATVAVAQSGAGKQNASDVPPTAAAQTAAQSRAAAAEHFATPPPLEPAATGAPHTEMLDPSKSSGHDPLLEPKPLPRADLSLIGGIVRRVDTVRNRVTVQPFGGGSHYVIYFDERTRILSGGHEATALAIHPGDRVSVDTQALGAEVFAKTIQVRTSTNAPMQASGQIIEVLGSQVRMQDRMSSEVVRFTLTPQTQVESHGVPATSAQLHSGSLIDVTFVSGKHEAQNIVIHATPGESYFFTGVLTNVDLRDGILALDNDVDGNNYELYFDPLEEKNVTRLVAGSSVRVNASFDGKRYRAEAITVTAAPN